MSIDLLLVIAYGLEPTVVLRMPDVGTRPADEVALRAGRPTIGVHAPVLFPLAVRVLSFTLRPALANCTGSHRCVRCTPPSTARLNSHRLYRVSAIAHLTFETASSNALSRSRTCNHADLGRAPLPLGYQSIPALTGALSQWMPEGLEPSFSGCKPDVLPVGRRTHVVRPGVAGRARTFNLGLRRAALVRSSCRNVVSSSLSNPGRIRTCTSRF